MQGKALEELNSDKQQSISSALDFFGDSLEQNNGVTLVSDNPTEVASSEKKRKRDKSKELEEALHAKKSKLNSSTNVLTPYCTWLL